MADTGDEMSFLLRVAVLGFGDEIGGLEICYQANELAQYPRAQATTSRGSVTMATVFKAAGLSETSSLQNLRDEYKQRLPERSHREKSEKTRLMDFVSDPTDSDARRSGIRSGLCSHRNLSGLRSRIRNHQ